MRDRVEGLVHLSNLSSRRVADPKEVASRGQEVWVKVTSIGAAAPGGGRPRVELSMRDVDQATGRDLLPAHAAAAPAMGLKGLSGVKVCRAVVLCHH